jgi:DNA repair exonuclease SbcCD ATPase subunit
MLELLDYAVEFPTTGRSFQNRIEFAPGLTAVTGPNEAGKTLVIEMIGYALFGKDALRGLASDYRNLAVTLALIVQDQEWVISRAKKEEFTIGGEVVAVGAQAINAEVPKRLGFDLKVFNIACAAQQGDLGALTDMKPTARRAMVDQLIGLDLLETIEKECKAEAKTNETVALSLLSSMMPPVEPVAPKGYVASAKLEEKLAAVQAHEAERAVLMRIELPVEPKPPIAPSSTDVTELEAHESLRQSALREQASLEGQLRGMPEPTVSREDLQRAMDYASYKAAVQARGPKPDYTEAQLTEFELVLAAKDDVRRGGDEVTCPKCEHCFTPGVDPSTVSLAQRDIPATITPREVVCQRVAHENWAEPLAEVEPFELPNLQQEILAHAHADDRRAVSEALASLTIPVDRSADLRTARAYQSELAVYTERARQYDRQLADWKDAQAHLATLADRSGELGSLQGRLAEARHFEQLRDRWLADTERYEDVCRRADDARVLGDGFAKGAQALRNARVRVKQELAPSLSKAASSLLYTMTGGERRYVDVDHDFNITVDGQPLQTLSGSGKSVVNLALRIGLGQVLTSKVLPIFIGDEIDESMDKSRSAATHSTFQNLRNYLTQILIVTHKPIEADNTISLA